MPAAPAPAREGAEEAEPPPQPPQPPEPPEPQGDSLVVEQFPCVYVGCPAFRLEVFANGHVRWLGIEFVAAAGERTAAIEPAVAQDFLERWSALPLDAAPATSEEAMLHPHAAVRCVTRTSDTEPVQRCAVLGIAEDSPESPAGKVDAFASDMERNAGAPDFMRSECYGFDEDSAGGFDRRARVGDGSAASTLARSFFRDPEHSVVRIVVAQRDVANAGALALRKELIESGVPLRAVRYERVALPSGVFKEQGWRYLMLGNPHRRDWGWASVVTPECLEADPLAKH